MNKNKINDLVSRAFKLVDNVPLLEDNTLKQIEQNLSIILSEEYKHICKNYSYEHLGDFFNTFRIKGRTLINETLELRKLLKLPHRFIYLASDGTTSYFMETKSNPDEPSPVYWIHWEEEERFCKEEPLQQDYDYFPSFTDFFENLIERKEEAAREYAEYEASLEKP